MNHQTFYTHLIVISKTKYGLIPASLIWVFLPHLQHVCRVLQISILLSSLRAGTIWHFWWETFSPPLFWFCQSLVLLLHSLFQEMTIVAACAPPGGGRNPVTPRFIRHFSILCLPTPSDHSLKQIFKVRIHTSPTQPHYRSSHHMSCHIYYSIITKMLACLTLATSHLL